MQYNKYRLDEVSQRLSRMGVHPIDVMVVGVTGAGKSTTLNSVFQKVVAKVGSGVDPETQVINHYSLTENIRLWDTPGLGDGVTADARHKKNMVQLLNKTYSRNNQEYGFVDLVLAIIDGSNRDMGTAYTLLNEVIVPNIQSNRIFIAVNQADMAMKGRHWLEKENKPDSVLKEFLDNQAVSIQNRIKEATGVTVKKPIYYSALTGYNVKALVDLIIDNIPQNKRSIRKR